VLIKVSSLTDHSFLIVGVPEKPTFIAWLISNKDTLYSMRLEGVTFISLDMDIGSASSDTKMGDIRFTSIKCLIRSSVRESRSRETIPDMNHRGNTMTPKG